MSVIKTLPLTVLLLVASTACDDPESEDHVDLCDVFCPKDSEPEPPPDDEVGICDILGCRVTSAQVGEVLGLTETEARDALRTTGYRPEAYGDGELRYLLDDADLADLASRL